MENTTRPDLPRTPVLREYYDYDTNWVGAQDIINCVCDFGGFCAQSFHETTKNKKYNLWNRLNDTSTKRS